MNVPIKPIVLLAGLAATAIAAAPAKAEYAFWFSGTVDSVDALATTPLGEVVDLMPDVRVGDPFDGFGRFDGQFDPITGELTLLGGSLTAGDRSPGSTLAFSTSILEGGGTLGLGLFFSGGMGEPAHQASEPSLGEFDLLQRVTVSLTPGGESRFDVSLHHSSLIVRDDLHVAGRITSFRIVPEPSSLALVTLGTVALPRVGRRPRPGLLGDRCRGR